MMPENKKSLDWHLNFQDEDYLSLSLMRLQQEVPPLRWCVQFSEIIEDVMPKDEKNLIVHDIGCNVGHFCRVLEKFGTKIEYCGFDISETYLKIARARYPSRQFSFLDIETGKLSVKSDISVVSATLEHIEGWDLAMKNILSTTKTLVLLRSFFGDSVQNSLYKKTNASNAYLIRQFTFQQVAELAEDFGFSVKFIRDQATDSVPQYLGCGVTRTQFIAVIEKRK